MPTPIPILEKYLYYYKAFCWDVIDADTIKIHWDLGRRTLGDETVRFSRINAIEKKDKGGLEATKYVEERILGKDIIIHTELDTREKTKYGGFGRFLAEVYYETDKGWINLNDELLEKGFAVYYKK